MRELGGDVLDPRDLCLYHASQYTASGFPFRPFDPEVAHRWVEGRWLDSGAPVWLAAAQVFYRFRSSFDDHFCQVTSNGLAAGRSMEHATERAVLELIERDAVMLAWLCRERGQRLPADLADEDVDRLVAELARCGAAVELYLLDGAGGVPVVLCLGFGDGRKWPGAVATSAAHVDVRSAARSALLEQGMTAAGLRRTMLDDRASRPGRPQDIRRNSFLDHAAYYLAAERRGAFDFLRAAAGEGVGLLGGRPPEDMSFSDVIRRLGHGGVRVAVVDLTSPDIALGPFRVVRAVATHLQPLHCGYGMERRAGARLKGRLRGAMNEDPHPFC
jgi:ribosomal protein S12 methylthiotransferase accessory factor